MTHETEHNGVVAVEAAETSFQPTHRHKKRGSLYQIIANAWMQAENWYQDMDGIHLSSVDNRLLVIYRGEDGRTWARPHSEFNDGRFEALPTHQGASQ